MQPVRRIVAAMLRRALGVAMLERVFDPGRKAAAAIEVVHDINPPTAAFVP
jgi:hypothetical protein